MGLKSAFSIWELIDRMEILVFLVFFLVGYRKFHVVLEGTDSSAGNQPMLASKSVEYDRKTVKQQIQVLHHINYLKHVKK